MDTISQVRDRWESLETRTQVAIAFPALFLFLFVLNLVAFSQPLGSSIIYGVIEGGLFTGFLVAATVAEKNRRGGGEPPPGGDPTG